MRVLLIHNPAAGHGDEESKDLAKLIKRAGHEVRLANRKSDDVEEALLLPADLVAVAGGDGSVTKVARALLGRPTPLTILPTGTANNLAHSLGITGEPADLIAGWDSSDIVPFDAAVAIHPWGRDTWFESAGFGLFTEAMCLAKAHAESEEKFTPDERFDRDFRLLRRMAGSIEPIPCTIEVDDRRFEQPALLCGVMNSRQIGSRLVLAPDANTGDGLLDLVLVTESERALLAEFLQRDHSADHPPHLPVYRGRRIHISSRIHRIHLDDEIEEFPVADQPWVLDVEVQPGAVRVLVPRLA
jgi:diacylglycerol kinase (ATP)